MTTKPTSVRPSLSDSAARCRTSSTPIQQFTIIASELDPTSDRIVEFLAESYGVPINAVFFRHFKDDDRDYLARTWLLDPSKLLDPSEAATRSGPLSRLGRFQARLLGALREGTT